MTNFKEPQKRGSSNVRKTMEHHEQMTEINKRIEKATEQSKSLEFDARAGDAEALAKISEINDKLISLKSQKQDFEVAEALEKKSAEKEKIAAEKRRIEAQLKIAREAATRRTEAAVGMAAKIKELGTLHEAYQKESKAAFQAAVSAGMGEGAIPYAHSVIDSLGALMRACGLEPMLGKGKSLAAQNEARDLDFRKALDYHHMAINNTKAS